ncbi:protein EMBRYONIC FLOWER 1 isoform X1 [Ipomoea triloba]|uniref:protein EMBRYONIC FLOWER 1 isoform X1 n=2 Tax=Ipomoea triloba TaxID=35885 RepID=UPI00125DC3C8|nr:protein EMBRYONIC FLOWER 1 isoform X1 [Ipomoea triloba]
MEKSNTAMGNQQISEYDNMVSRPSGSLVKIDSITIDLGHIAMQKIEEGNCQHSFSIRGYVAGMREKDKKSCSPFTKSSDNSDPEEQLPPLVVRKFRWWRCENCVQDLLSENAGKDNGIASNSCRSTPFICNPCIPTPSRGNTEKLPLEMEHVPTSGKNERNTAVTDASAALGDNRSLSLSRHTSETNSGIEGTNAHDDRSEYIVQERESHSDGDGQRIASTTHEKAKLYTNTSEALDNSVEEARRLPSIKLRDDGEGSSESDGETGKARFRLLTDLLSGQVNLENSCTNSAQASLDQMPVAYSDGGSADLEKGIKSPHRKRKTPQELECKVSEAGSRINTLKNARASKEVTEKSPIAIDIPDSQSEQDGSAEGGLHARTKIRQNKRKIDRETGTKKKKSKQAHVDDGCSSIIPWPTTPLGSGDLKKYGTATNAGIIQSSHCASSEGNMEHHLENMRLLMETRIEARKSSCASSNNNKFPEIGYYPSSVVYPGNHLLGESSNKRKNVESWTTHSEVGNFRMPHDASAKVGLDLSLNSFRDPKARGIEIDFNRSVNLQKGDKIGDPRRKGLIREQNAVKADQSLKGVLCDLNAQTTITFQGKQNFSTLVEERSLPLHKKMDFSIQKNEAKEFRGSAEANKHKKSQRRDEESEQGPPDDIPMEIVELMAQNQYERGLGEKPKSQANSNAAKGYSDGYGNKSMAWQSPGLNYFQHDHARRDLTVASKVMGGNGGSFTSSKLNRGHFEVNQMEENQLHMSGVFPLSLKKLSSGGQLSACGSVRNGFRVSEEANPLWAAPATTHFGRGTIQKSTSQSKNKELDAQVQNLLHHKGKTISDIKANEVKKQSESHPFFSKPREGEASHKNMVSLESYANEAIPAMQLLSLMDKKVPSSRGFNLDANKIPEKPFMPCDYHPNFSRDVTQNFFDRSLFPHQHSKQFSDLRSGVSNPGESSGQPLPSLYNQISFKSQEQEKPRRLYAPSLLGGSKLHSSASSSGTPHMTQGSFSVRDMQGGFLCLPGPTSFPLQDHILEHRPKNFELGRGSIPVTAWPMKSTVESNTCSLNQNPAEFTDPEAWNMFTISGKDLKIGKKNSSRERSYAAANVDGRKRQRNTKVRTGKEPEYGNL